MRITVLRTVAVGLLPLAIGCSPQPTAVKSASTSKEAMVSPETAQAELTSNKVIGDPATIVATLDAVTATLRKDPQGSIIEVDLRGKQVDDELLAGLAQLPRLRSLILAAVKLSDDQLIPIGRIESLENLDLRDCPISDKGLAHLASLIKLKSLRLSGKSGVCTVGDDGMQHVGKLLGLKVLAADNLWISEDGLKSLLGLRNLQ